MYDDIQKGLIDTVIVKDQSRFGRSYIQVGMYVEQFKDMGVRFIAVDDCYDSSQTDYDMMFPMRNVINEYYAREASKKTKSAKKAKAKAGQFIGSKPPFGYKLDPNDRHHLIVDEPAAEVVRRIFTLASQGNGFTRIAKILREEKVLTPIRKYTYLNELTAEVLNSLIDKIVVHHKEVGSDGKEYQQIEIYYRFIGRLDAAEQVKKLLDIGLRIW